jgi:hypothetical protein
VDRLGKVKARWAEAIICDECPIIEWGYEMGYRKRETALSRGLDGLRTSLNILCREWGLST